MAVVDEQAVELGKLRSSGWMCSGLSCCIDLNMMAVVWCDKRKDVWLMVFDGITNHQDPMILVRCSRNTGSSTVVF